MSKLILKNKKIYYFNIFLNKKIKKTTTSTMLNII
jgi:hypothetical protein